MKNVGIYLDAAPGGGTYQYNLAMLEACRSLPQDSFNLLVAYSSPNWKSHFPDNDVPTRSIQRTVTSRTWFQIRYPHSLWIRVGKYIDRFVKEFISCQRDIWIFPSQDVWSYSLPVNSLSTIHDLMHRYERKFTEAGSSYEYHMRERHYSLMCRYSKGVLVDSELGKQQVLDSYHPNAEKIHVLPFVAPRYLEKKDYQIDLAKIYGLPQKFLFYPAQFWEHKNHKSLVKAVDQLTDRIPDIHFVFVGAPKNAYQSIKDLIYSTNLDSNFTFLDYVPDDHMAALYRSARGMIMPTFFGPTNIPPLEAFATGCPVALSNIYAMPAQVGAAALLFDPHSIPEIVKVIEEMWTDDHLIQQLILKGRKQDRLWNQTKFNVRLKEIIEVIV